MQNPQQLFSATTPSANDVVLQCPMCEVQHVWFSDPSFINTPMGSKLVLGMGCNQGHAWVLRFRSEDGVTVASIKTHSS